MRDLLTNKFNKTRLACQPTQEVVLLSSCACPGFMRIAQIAPIIERVPPQKYGGTERVVYALTEQLVKRGHDVTLFASGDSQTSAKLISVFPKALREARLLDIYGLNTWTLLNIGLAYKMQGQFDIIHDHTGHIGLPLANISQTPAVITLHGPFTTDNKAMFKVLDRHFLVTISHAQMPKNLKLTNHLGTVYNGLEMSRYPFSKKDKGYLLFVGRISMEKGVHHAITVAQHLNLPLIIAAKLESFDMPYFQEYVGPRLSDQIRWVGEVDETERNKLMSQALCSLHPVTWAEPFGLTMIEAMACGCPVVAMNKGSIPEIVVDQKTGFIVEDVDEMIEAVQKIRSIRRESCRKHALKNFCAGKMAEGYENIYRRILQSPQIG